MSFVFALAAAVSAAPAITADDPAFVGTCIRSDGETLYCVRHRVKPTILTPRYECNTLTRWSRLVAQRGDFFTPAVQDPAMMYGAAIASSPRRGLATARPIR